MLDIKQITDLGLAGVAILAMAWLLERIMRWQLEERRTWTSKVEEWGKGQQADKTTLIDLVKQVTAVIDHMTETISDEKEARAEAGTVMCARTDVIIGKIDKVQETLDKQPQVARPDKRRVA